MSPASPRSNSDTSSCNSDSDSDFSNLEWDGFEVDAEPDAEEKGEDDDSGDEKVEEVEQI